MNTIHFENMVGLSLLFGWKTFKKRSYYRLVSRNFLVSLKLVEGYFFYNLGTLGYHPTFYWLQFQAWEVR